MEIVRKLELYDMGRNVPDEAKKPISAGRLKGMTDINPMWRIKRLTEMFGPCGIGWWYVIKDKRMERGSKDEVCAFVDIDLFYKYNDEVSQPIPGTGGSKFVALEKNGLYTSDECFKMALTDAISVSAKAIGIGADVYYAADRDKYTSGNDTEQCDEPPVTATQRNATPPTQSNVPKKKPFVCDNCGLEIVDYTDPITGEVTQAFAVVNQSLKTFRRKLCPSCYKKAREATA